MADEPTGNLDSKVGKEIMNLLLDLNKQRGTTLIIVTHDPTIAAQTQRVIRLRDGVVEEDGLPKEISNEPFASHPRGARKPQFQQDAFRSHRAGHRHRRGGGHCHAGGRYGAQDSITGSISGIGTNLLFVFRGGGMMGGGQEVRNPSR